MKKTILLLKLTYWCLCSFAQKPPLDNSALDSWPTISNEQISNDGRYVIYYVSSNSYGKKLCINYSDGRNIRDFKDADNAIFTEDSHKIIFTLPGDSLCIFTLASNTTIWIENVASFKTPKDGNGQWLAWKEKIPENNLILADLFSNVRKVFLDVNDFSISNTGKVMLLQFRSRINSIESIKLQWYNLETGNAKEIWHGNNISKIVFNSTENSMALLAVPNPSDPSLNTISYYSEDMDSANLLISTSSPGIKNGLIIGNRDLSFSADGDKLFFQLCHNQTSNKKDNPVTGVHIWNYKDQVLRSIKDNEEERQRSDFYLAVCKIQDKKVIRLQTEDDGGLAFFQVGENGNADFALSTSKANLYEAYYRLSGSSNINLISTKDGERICIKKNVYFGHPFYSPGGKFIVWYDYLKQGYFVYDVNKQIIKSVTNRIQSKLYAEPWDFASPAEPYLHAAWIDGDSALLIYDRYDIWKVDPCGIQPPINLTNAYGRRNKIIFRYVAKEKVGTNLMPTSKKDETILLCAFNETTKENGFFKKKVNENGDPIKLIMSPDFYYFSQNISYIYYPSFIVKAKKSNVFLVKKTNAIEFPNLYVTSDFSKFIPASNLEPQKKFNWLTSELVNWTTLEGRPGQGILYKPEDFDPKRKYPLIIYMYDRMSDGVNMFIDPELCVGPINIPWFVSHEYLVLCPDIYYRVGYPGKSIYDYIVSAAKIMRKMPWIDSNRIGIQGHSWGGYEVNYLVTHTKLFAAAASAAGFADMVSLCGEPISNIWDPHFFVEQAQGRMGVTLWQNTRRYIINSPVFYADKVTTPLLIMHNKNDANVPWEQSFELFSSLRRLNKPCWMLEYDSEAHILGTKNALDYTKKLMDFFNYYLKKKPEPDWMKNYIHYN